MLILKKKLEVKYFITNVLVPLVVLVLYCISFAYLSSRLFTEGVNYIFVSRLWNYALLLLVGLCFIFFVIFKLKKADKFAFKFSTEKLHVSDLILLFLPLTPVVQYILNNQDILSLIESLSVLVFFIFFSSLYIYVIPVFLGIVTSTRALMICWIQVSSATVII